MPELGLTITYKLTFKTYLNYLDESIDDNFFYDNFNELILITNPSQANNLDWIKVPKNKKFIFYFFNYYYLINLDKMPENEQYFFWNFFWSFRSVSYTILTPTTTHYVIILLYYVPLKNK
ncbi:hypothetical protein, partial [Metamycoplasma hyosynoviae]|uniref:hypothetical protein n=1 Tax=Metamycoplasma hyosynoviae TaxID=29559 RepID=UPI0023589E52